MIGTILYVLPSGGFSGGANSVVQEVAGFIRMGLDARIAVDARNYAGFSHAYASMPALTTMSALTEYADTRELRLLLAQADVVVCTVATSVSMVLETCHTLPQKRRPRLFYYIQDYEPLFFERGSDDWTAAYRSYGYGAELRGMAKTDWLCETVRARHGMIVSRVQASLDHGVFHPLLNRRSKAKPVIAAMLRPSTPRRAPRRTCRILNRLAAELGDGVSIMVFGCGTDELLNHSLALDPSIERHGRLTREQVAHLLRRTDLFLDLSDYQAFGRTGLEAMACGAVALLPVFGGAKEFIIHEENGFVIDVRNEAEIVETVHRFVGLPETTRKAMLIAALRTAAGYSVQNACVSILDVFLSE